MAERKTTTNIAFQKLKASCFFLLILSFLHLFVISTFFTLQTKPVFAEEDFSKDFLETVSHRKLSDIEQGNISTNCSSIQSNLKKLQKTDSKTRVTLGASYQNLLSHFITPLNIRLVKNNLPDPLLTKNQSELISFRNDFASLFITYSQRLESLIGLDCKSNPDVFYIELENVRFLRSKLEESTQKINATISTHLKTVEQLRTSLSSVKKLNHETEEIE